MYNSDPEDFFFAVLIPILFYSSNFLKWKSGFNGFNVSECNYCTCSFLWLYKYYLFLLHGLLCIAPHNFIVSDSDCAFIKFVCHIKMWLFSGPHPEATEVNKFMKGSEPVITATTSSPVLFMYHFLPLQWCSLLPILKENLHHSAVQSI